MCWFKLPKVSVPSIQTPQLQQTANAKDPDSAVLGGTKSWEQASKKKGVSALTIKKSTLDKATNSTDNTGVNYNM